MRKLPNAAALVIATLACGCASSGDGSTSSTSSSSGTSPTPDPSKRPDASATTSSSGTTAATGPQAPELTRVMKMAGALHTVWRNEPTCEFIEGERRATTAAGVVQEPYAVVFTVPGTLNNQMDDAATGNFTYTYRLRCKIGAAYSDYSNEMSNNPTQ